MTPKPENNQPPRSLARPQLCHGEKPRQSAGKGWEGLGRAGKGWEGLTLPTGTWSTTGTNHCWIRVTSHRDTHLALVRRAPCPRLCPPRPPPQRDGCRGMDTEGWMGCIQPCSSHRHSQHQLLSPVTSICPRGRISILQKDGTAVPPRAGSRATAQGTAPSDTARSAPAPFPPATAPQLPGEAPSDTAGRFQSLWREGKSKPG